jgi:pimeloyl-ACP methyl ester carboxylesterase
MCKNRIFSRNFWRRIQSLSTSLNIARHGQSFTVTGGSWGGYVTVMVVLYLGSSVVGWWLLSSNFLLLLLLLSPYQPDWYLEHPLYFLRVLRHPYWSFLTCYEAQNIKSVHSHILSSHLYTCTLVSWNLAQCPGKLWPFRLILWYGHTI